MPTPELLHQCVCWMRVYLCSESITNLPNRRSVHYILAKRCDVDYMLVKRFVFPIFAFFFFVQHISKLKKMSLFATAPRETHLVEFNAGKCIVEGSWIKPDIRKGYETKSPSLCYPPTYSIHLL